MRSAEVLVVDDNPADALLIKQLLEEQGRANVNILHDGEEALRLLLAHYYHPDLIVLDLRLPKLDGHQVLQRVRRHVDTRIPIIVMSSSRNPDDSSQAYANGANAYMAKPTDLDGFIRMIESLTRLWIEPLARALP